MDEQDGHAFENLYAVPSRPPDYVLLRDDTGQPWAVTVRPDGQLQTAKYPNPGLDVPIIINSGGKISQSLLNSDPPDRT